MKIGIMQPYFMPYIGYWQLMNLVDTYVVYDDVNFIKKGWINRNYILLNGEKHLFTIKLSGASQNKKINEIELLDDFSKLRKTLQMAYCKAPYFVMAMEAVDRIFRCDERSLSHFILNSFYVIAEYLNITTEFILSSDIEKNNELKGNEKIKQMCSILGADEYYNAIGGMELYDKEDFKKNGVNLRFLKTGEIAYKQYCNTFVPNLSLIDVIMFNNPNAIAKDMLNEYQLL